MDGFAGYYTAGAAVASDGCDDQQAFDAVQGDHYVAASGFGDSAAGYDSGEFAVLVSGRWRDSGGGSDEGFVLDDDSAEFEAVRAEH